MKVLPDNSINCCITSPPYFGLRDYGVDGQIGLEQSPEEYVDKLVNVFKEVRRVLKDDGTLWLNLGDCYAGSGKGAAFYPENAMKYKQGTNKGILGKPALKQGYVPVGCKPKDLLGIPWMVAFALRADGWYLRQDIIWAKGNPMPESVKDRCTRSHEYLFMLSKQNKYYYDNESIKEPCVNGDPTSPRGSIGVFTPNSGRRKQDDLGKRQYTGFNDRYFSKPPLTHRNKRDVWNINVKPFKGAHFATFPESLIEPCVLAGCPEGGIVLDPFIGAGTVGVVAKRHNRNYIGYELNTTYCDIANKRIQDIV